MKDLADRGCAYYALDKLLQQHSFTYSQLIIDNANKVFPIESNKSDMYSWLTSLGVRMPHSVEWHNTKDILAYSKFPFVVKQNTSVTLGLQTVVVKSKSDLAEVVKSVLFTKCSNGIIQDYVVGKELTVTFLVGTENFQLVGAASDYKKQYNGDIGLNTSGMGSVNVLHVPSAVIEQCNMVVKAFQHRYGYRGFLSCQFLVDEHNVPWLMECNNRLCSPEFQSMAVNLPANFGECIYASLSAESIPKIILGNLSAVTVGFLHTAWPTPQATRSPIDFSDSPFEVVVNNGKWDYNCYFGTLTNSGDKTHEQLAEEIYLYLQTKDVSPYRYRTDIGKLAPVV